MPFFNADLLQSLKNSLSPLPFCSSLHCPVRLPCAGRMTEGISQTHKQQTHKQLSFTHCLGLSYAPSVPSLRLYVIDDNDLTKRVARRENATASNDKGCFSIPPGPASARTPNLSLRAARIAAMKSEPAKFRDSPEPIFDSAGYIVIPRQR
jgi:hypothetical protein